MLPKLQFLKKRKLKYLEKIASEYWEVYDKNNKHMPEFAGLKVNKLRAKYGKLLDNNEEYWTKLKAMLKPMMYAVLDDTTMIDYYNPQVCVLFYTIGYIENILSKK